MAVLVAGGLLFYWYFLRTAEVGKLNGVRSIERLAVTEIQKQISTPTPLRKAPVASPAQSLTLTRSGIISYTNIQRKDNGGLPPLAENAPLDDIAKLRLRDMFQKQYFAHVAPDGGSAETAAKAVGYDYLALGENLALGNFAGDKGVVEAWMNSPGHRANILGIHYTEIGTAAGEGIFEGEDTWIAVQVFGKPLSACPFPDAALKAVIDAAVAELAQMETEIQSEKTQLDAMGTNDPSAYNQKVNEYNALVDRYNVFLEQTKSQISAYNGEVNIFNQCVKS